MCTGGHSPSRNGEGEWGRTSFPAPRAGRGTVGFSCWKGRPGRPNAAGFSLPQSPYPFSNPLFLPPPTSSSPSRAPPLIQGQGASCFVPQGGSQCNPQGSVSASCAPRSCPSHRVPDQNHTVSEIRMCLSSPP